MSLHRRFCPVALLLASFAIAAAARATEIDPATVTSLSPPEATALVAQGHDVLELPRLESLSGEAARALAVACGRLGTELVL
ncbi:MAG: hypothetical protein EBX35_02615, partial [Planctomycetia bacterium]|nr:hypothetical protein [Planctomycetia bacterium]